MQGLAAHLHPILKEPSQLLFVGLHLLVYLQLFLNVNGKEYPQTRQDVVDGLSVLPAATAGELHQHYVVFLHQIIKYTEVSV